MQQNPKPNYLSSEVLEDGGEIDRSAGADTLGVFTSFEKTRDSADGKLETSFRGAGDGFRGLGLASPALGGGCGIGTHFKAAEIGGCETLGVN